MFDRLKLVMAYVLLLRGDASLSHLGHHENIFDVIGEVVLACRQT